jgi:RimJ/RimL family protein N-acetyltransferase
MNTLRVGSLTLEPQLVAHAAEMFNVLSDPAIYEFESSPPESQAWLERRFAVLEARASAGSAEQWLNWVVRLPTGALAGYVQATIDHNGMAQIAYELASRFWRQGIASAAVTAMLVELEACYGVRVAVATVKATNYRSLALLKSLRFESQPPRASPVVDHRLDEIVMYKAVDTDRATI